MKYLILINCLILMAITMGFSQQAEFNKNNEEIFAKMALQGVDVNQKLLYGYFFYNKNKENLEKLKTELVNQGYTFVRLEKVEDEKNFILHVERIEALSLGTLDKREKELANLAKKFKVDSYDGWDVGNVNPSKPLTNIDDFAELIKKKKKEELFDFAMTVYNAELYKNALMVFDECVQQGIKLDTSRYKLANCLIELNQIDLGIAQFEKVIELNPLYYAAYFNLGSVCYDHEKFDKSILNYQKTTEINPKDARAFYGLAASQYAAGNKKESRINCEKALKLDAKNENALILMKMLGSR
jgi:tetratricopeptide (TPR) repeat protein